MSYTPEQALAIALYNSSQFERLQDTVNLAKVTLPRLRAMGFDITDFAHSAWLMPDARKDPSQ